MPEADGRRILSAAPTRGRTRKLIETTMGTNAGAYPKREVVQFPPNQPITLALKYEKPKIGMRPGGDDYAMFTTVDDRIISMWTWRGRSPISA
jgi:hypothetical protein